jgi:hypothetical protein
MGELLALRVARGKWILSGIRLPFRVPVWGVLGILVTLAFTIFNAGVDALIRTAVLPVPSERFVGMIITAFYKSLFLNVVFGFQFMTFHRITDTLIERGELLRRWPFLEIWKGINWENMWGVVGFSILWFWIPAQTFTFCLPPEFRILTAALLSVCLGVILSFAKIKAEKAH